MKIVNIISFYNKKIEENENFFVLSPYYEGFEIETTSNKYMIAINNDQRCCESFGHISSSDDFEPFIGAEIIKLEVVKNGDWEKSDLLKQEIEYGDIVDCAFINVETSSGLLQFAVYNNHSGYYGHDILVTEGNKNE